MAIGPEGACRVGEALELNEGGPIRSLACASASLPRKRESLSGEGDSRFRGNDVVGGVGGVLCFSFCDGNQASLALAGRLPHPTPCVDLSPRGRGGWVLRLPSASGSSALVMFETLSCPIHRAAFGINPRVTPLAWKLVAPAAALGSSPREERCAVEHTRHVVTYKDR